MYNQMRITFKMRVSEAPQRLQTNGCVWGPLNAVKHLRPRSTGPSAALQRAGLSMSEEGSYSWMCLKVWGAESSSVHLTLSRGGPQRVITGFAFTGHIFPPKKQKWLKHLKQYTTLPKTNSSEWAQQRVGTWFKSQLQEQLRFITRVFSQSGCENKKRTINNIRSTNEMVAACHCSSTKPLKDAIKNRLLPWSRDPADAPK